MIACIDIDDTLTAWPDVIMPLARALRVGGWRVVLLTGCVTPAINPDTAPMVEARRKQVAAFNVEYDAIEVCPGRTVSEIARAKAAYLARVGAAVFLDDNAEYCAAARQTSPRTLTLRVPERTSP